MNDLRAELAKAGRLREEAETARAETLDRIGRLVRVGAERGLPVAEMARLVGVSRTTVYAMLDDH